MSSKEIGGLVVKSLFALNRGLLFKWVWRFRDQLKVLWVHVLNTINGASGHIYYSGVFCNSLSPWLSILTSVVDLCTKGVDIFSFCKKCVGDGSLMTLWDDIWLSDCTLRNKFDRFNVLDTYNEVW